MNKIEEMAVFVRVVEAGSLSAAARALRRSPSSVSKILTGLEDRLGVRLITRNTRHLQITDTGQDYYQRCRLILEDITEAEERASALHAEPGGTLRVVGMNILSQKAMMPILTGFLEKYPRISLEIHQTDIFPDLVKSGIDLALRIGGVSTAGLECVELMPSRRVICAAPDYIAVHGRPRTLSQLHLHNCMTFATNEALNTWELEGAEGTESIHVSGNLAASTAELIRQAALNGWGVCQLSDVIIGPDLKNGALVPLFPEQLDQTTNHICAVYPKRRSAPKKVLAFVEHMREALGKEGFLGTGQSPAH